MPERRAAGLFKVGRIEFRIAARATAGERDRMSNEPVLTRVGDYHRQAEAVLPQDGCGHRLRGGLRVLINPAELRVLNAGRAPNVRRRDPGVATIRRDRGRDRQQQQ